MNKFKSKKNFIFKSFILFVLIFFFCNKVFLNVILFFNSFFFPLFLIYYSFILIYPSFLFLLLLYFLSIFLFIYFLSFLIFVYWVECLYLIIFISFIYLLLHSIFSCCSFSFYSQFFSFFWNSISFWFYSFFLYPMFAFQWGWHLCGFFLFWSWPFKISFCFFLNLFMLLQYCVLDCVTELLIYELEKDSLVKIIFKYKIFNKNK